MILIECLASLHLKHFHFNNMTTNKKTPAGIDEYMPAFRQTPQNYDRNARDNQKRSPGND
jgi:hypothetical protein